MLKRVKRRRRRKTTTVINRKQLLLLFWCFYIHVNVDQYVHTYISGYYSHFK